MCRRHGISAHSGVMVQAKKGDWQAKREAYQAKASESFIAHHADRMAAREAEVRDHALDALDEAIIKFRSDLKATKSVRRPDGSIAEEPAFLMTPRDLCPLIDRFQILFDRPSTISQHQGLTVTSEVATDALREFIELTRGEEPPTPMSPLPRSSRPLDD